MLINLGYPVESDLLLFSAAFNRNPEIMKILISNGADINTHFAEDRNFAHYAAVNKNKNVLEWIKKNENCAHLLQEKDDKGHILEYYIDHKEEF